MHTSGIAFHIKPGEDVEVHSSQYGKDACLDIGPYEARASFFFTSLEDLNRFSDNIRRAVAVLQPAEDKVA